jgi:ASC-1-like (ASCH) protein
VIHVVSLKDAPLAEIVAGRKRFEFRLGFRRLARDPVREGDLCS